MNEIIIICGPTASSKTALAVEVAKKLNTDVVSADSLYVYKGLNIGTAKPTVKEMDGVNHHLIDVCEPTDTFSVGDYRELALPIIKDLLSKGKTPIICGGTGFYINSILYDFSYGDGKGNLELRDYYFNLAEERGNQFVFNILKEKDYQTSLKLHQNDLKRVIRALEICENGRKKSEIIDEQKPLFNYKAFCVDFPREVLYDRINRRVDIMFDNGLIEEVNNLLDLGVNRDSQCMQGIGYKEVFDYFDGKIDLYKLKETIKLNTRHYAKRQITYFKKLQGLIYLEPNNINELSNRIIEQL